MEEALFWQIIGLADGSPEAGAIDRIRDRLLLLDPDEILGFEDRLAEVLHRLDRRSIARQPWRDVSEPRWLPRIPGISADGFLYARCAAVLRGPGEVAAILADPKRFKRRWDVQAEGLLSVAPGAWEVRTGRPGEYSHESPLSYETGSNPEGGWGGPSS